ncbi:hypothetical protein [Amycolatopsis samaneae]|uniref:Gram-positive cocci surface proteins LPxTG domain-containing protein n=1 Tax=Amycolatopsis samaneae TaxID=664691 RepID=A0ABW5GDS3_9PSEU
MKRSAVLAAGLAAGFVLVAPFTAFAAEEPTPTTSAPAPTTSAPAPTTSAPAPTTSKTLPPLKPGQVPGYINLGPASGAVPGQEVIIDAQCWENFRTNPQYTSSLLGTGELRMVGWDNISVLSAKATIPSTAKPGTYTISFTCYGTQVTGEFVVKDAPAQQAPAKPVPAKQVGKVPSGAPQTGGTDDPAGDGTPFAVAGALGVLAAGGAGFAVYRRRSAQR